MGSLESNKPSPQFRPLDPEDFRRQAHEVVDFIADYYKSIESFPVVAQVQPGYLHASLPSAAPHHPESLPSILHDVRAKIIPGMTHWLSPNFFAFFPATVSTAAFLGEMLCTSFNAVGFNWLSSPAATELEMVVMDWLAAMLQLPRALSFASSGGGVIHNTTSEAILVTLIAARDRTLARLDDGLINRLVVYASDQTHSTFPKACKIAGISPANIRVIPTTSATAFALSADDLRAVVAADVDKGLVPLYLCANVGTTSTTAVDPIEALAVVANDYDMWVHIDAAYAGSACICPEFRHHLNGVEKVDSLSLSPHKWLLTYLDCCCLWVRSRAAIVEALSTNPEYLWNRQSESESVVDYKDWQIGTGRRFKSLRLWLVLRSYGVANLQNHIRSDVRLARMFDGFVRADPRFELTAPTRFSLVCFRLKPSKVVAGGHVEAVNRKLLEKVNSCGRIYITHTIVGGTFMLRLAVGATFTEERHVIAAWKLINSAAEELLRQLVTS